MLLLPIREEEDLGVAGVVFTIVWRSVVLMTVWRDGEEAKADGDRVLVYVRRWLLKMVVAVGGLFLLAEGEGS